MIPTLILFGVFGRWWRVTLVVSALGWPILLVATGVMSVEPGLVGASGLAVLNTGVGVLIHQGILWTGRRLRGPWPRARAFDAAGRRTLVPPRACSSSETSLDGTWLMSPRWGGGPMTTAEPGRRWIQSSPAKG